MRNPVGRAFDRASGGYDKSAVLQAAVRGQLIERLEIARIEPAVILDAGASTGHASLALKRRHPKARVIAFDLAPRMLAQAGRRQSLWRKFDRVCADAAALPFADGRVDLIFCNLLLQWCEPDPVLREFRRVLKSGGLLALASLGPDTLRELRSAWAAVDPHPHVNVFIDMHDLGDALVRAGFAAPVLDVERFTLNYRDVPALLKDLKAIGANTLRPDAGAAMNASAPPFRGLTGRRRFAAMVAAYEQFRLEDRLPASFEVVFANAWAAPPSHRSSTSAEAGISLEELSAELRKRRGGSGTGGGQGVGP